MKEFLKAAGLGWLVTFISVIFWLIITLACLLAFSTVAVLIINKLN